MNEHTIRETQGIADESELSRAIAAARANMASSAEEVFTGKYGSKWARRPCRLCGYKMLEPVERNPAHAVCNVCFCR